MGGLYRGHLLWPHLGYRLVGAIKKDKNELKSTGG